MTVFIMDQCRRGVQVDAPYSIRDKCLAIEGPGSGFTSPAIAAKESNWSRTADHPLILPAAALVFLVPSREH
jgi:hypothetical protein